jgi:putative Mg2+ transporter-C (MgtC) family protein
MAGMSTSIGWSEIALRLGLTVVAGLALGFDRSERGKAAGLRTTTLVCLAASIAMIQVNLLLPTAGRASDSFVMNDLMRFPLGILTGVGFIGGGAILRRGDLVVGLTTAATLWLATVVGLCLGGGQIELGIAATAIGLLTLGPVGWVELVLPRQRIMVLALELHEEFSVEQEIRRRISEAGFSIVSSRVMLQGSEGRCKFIFQLRFTRPLSDTTTPPLFHSLAAEAGVAKVEWRIRS